MHKKSSWAVVASMAVVLAAATAATPAARASGQVLQINMAEQPLGDSLRELAALSKTNIAFDPLLVRGMRAPALVGSLTAQEALSRLLEGTQLRVKFVDEKTVSLVPATRAEQSEPTARASEAAAAMRVARSGGAAGDAQSARSSSEESAQVSNDEHAKSEMQEIIVTAQKREERLLEVPVPVTAISAQALMDSNQVSIKDYYTRIPGLNVNPTGFGGPQVVLRGITTGGYANPTVGVVIDEVPYGSSTNIGGLGSVIPDVDPSDLSRVEVLRGPQGTFYGASALGGLLKFATVDPSTDGVRGRIQGGMSTTASADDPGYSFRGSINVPVSETLAVLASGFTRRDSGYVDNIQTGEEGVNSTRISGGRVSALWRPTQDVSLKLSAMLQDVSSDGADEANPLLGELRQDKLLGTGGYDKKVHVYAATLNAKLGGVDLVSASGYTFNDAGFISDYTPFFGAFATSTFGKGGAPLVQTNETKKFTQEIRLSGRFGSRVEWLLGGFYMDEDSKAVQDLPAVDPATGARAGLIYAGAIPNLVTEYAAFGGVTVKITDRFDVQLGGRQSWIDQSQTGIQSGALVGGVEIVTDEVESDASAFTYLVTPRLKITEDTMVYARLASGYRVGGPNPNITLLGLPRAFEPDKTKNYEIGFKGEVLDRRLSFDASIYHIDWDNIQLQVTSGGFLFYTNAGGARSRGIELTMEARPTEGLRVGGWAAWNDAALKEAFPAGSVGIYGVDGDRLPFSSRFSGSLSVDQDFPLSANLTGFAGAAISYQGERPSIFASSAATPRAFFPSYVRTDLRAGVEYGSWTVNLFANNLTDRRVVLGAGVAPGNVLYIQPRTIGLNVSKTF